ncbi:MAG: aldo/keto reductase [Microgenomates group bacterium Gr01-1014_7]|nr:MAG: aldo/keto reductase [Microgenomates group bacterium Gr01-1014_7]
MIFQKLGSSQTTVSVLGLGTNGVGNFYQPNLTKVRSRQKIYKTAFENGLILFDSAELYGEGYAEFILGKTFSRKRDQIIISTKVNPDNCSSFRLRKSLKDSLKRLQTDYIDLYQVHWINPFIDLEETFITLEQFVKEGYIKHIGVCNFSPLMISQANKFLNKYKIVSNQIEFNLQSQYQMLKDFQFYKKNNITIIGYGALNHLNSFSSPKQKQLMEFLTKKYKKTLSQLIINYLTSFKNTIQLIKTDNITHLQENIRSFDFELEKKDFEEIKTNFYYQVQFVPVKKIKIENELKIDRFQILQNSENFIPSPLTIAQTLVKYGFFKPLKLIKKNDFFYLDSYDLQGEYKKYLAWRLIYDISSQIPAIVI